MPSGILLRIEAWLMSLRASSFGIAMERGGKAERLHVQGVIEVRCPDTPQGRSLIERNARFNIPIPAGDNYLVNIKPLEQGQTEQYMLGYIQKDRGLAHYAIRTFNYTDEDLERARQEYNSVSRDFVGGKIVLNKAHIFKQAFSFWFTYVNPIVIPFHVIVLYMLQSGAYMFSGGWAATPNGRALSRVVSESLWRIVQHPGCVRVRDVFQVLYGDKWKGEFTSLGEFPKVPWEFFTFQEVCYIRRQYREAQSDLEPSERDDLWQQQRLLLSMGKSLLIASRVPQVVDIIQSDPRLFGFDEVCVPDLRSEVFHAINDTYDNTALQAAYEEALGVDPRDAQPNSHLAPVPLPQPSNAATRATSWLIDSARMDMLSTESESNPPTTPINDTISSDLCRDSRMSNSVGIHDATDDPDEIDLS